MNLCLLVAGRATTIAATAFTLSWSHSVEHSQWRESWRVEPAGLRLVEAAVRGSGAGMEPGDDARIGNGWYVWSPRLPVQSELRLAASGATSGGWLLCHDRGCLVLGAQAQAPAILKPCG